MKIDTLKLLKYAKKIAVGKKMKDRINDNYPTIQRRIDEEDLMDMANKDGDQQYQKEEDTSEEEKGGKESESNRGGGTG